MVPSSSEGLTELEVVKVTEPLQISHVSTIKKRVNVRAFLRTNAFVLLTVAAVIIGISLGFVLRSTNMTTRDILYFGFPGELLMRMLQMIVLPLIVSSVITGMSSVDRKISRNIGLWAIIYYMVTTVIAAFTGIGLAVSIKPGKFYKNTTVASRGNAQTVRPVDSFLDLIRNMFPKNLLEACLRKYKTVYFRSQSTEEQLGHDNLTSMNISLKDDTMSMPGTSDGVNVMGVLVVSMAIGLVLGHMESEGKPLRDFFDCLNKAIMHLVNLIIWYCPVGIIFLLAEQVAQMSDITMVGLQIAMYALVVVVGLAIHSFITLPAIYAVTTRRNPYRFMRGLLQALSTAFGTASSSATLPVTFQCLEETHNMDKRVTRFMLPVGATMNMDGGALYEAVAALFIAQIHDMDFNLGQIIVLSMIVTAVSTGAAGIPQAGMVSMIIVLSSTGLPTEDISLLLIVDWILDRLRTATNVLGDCIGVGVVQHLSQDDLKKNAPVEEPAEESLNRSLINQI
ncbi:excitatory amino acid transporter 1-like [Thalassophryne amazonica]|uniref:excitatory amino acid transporter 1-like n=1 Tax=Thalassophryne amazonica TaxID=390379 RepID=UPI0014708FDB|nr:excitatory amino acid transporter 1-like [Thalassophryne amazonica]